MKNLIHFKEKVVAILIVSLLVAGISQPVFSQGVLINNGTPPTTADASSMLEVRSSTLGILIPRMASDPSSPAIGLLYYNTVSNAFKYYNGIGWITLGTGSGNGTVTSFSSGALSPIFTTSVANATTSPALSFSISNAGAYSILGNNTGSGAAPAYFPPTLASALFQNQGSATTVLHGGGAGGPTWGSIALGTDVTGVLPIANGGTNSSATATAGGVGYGTGTAHAYTSAGTAGQFLQSAGSGAPVWVSPTIGTVSSVTSADANATVANTTTAPIITIVAAPKLATARSIAGANFDGSTNISLANKFVVQGTSDLGLSGAQFLGSLGTGIVKNTTSTGVLSIATGADLPSMTSTIGGAVPTPPNNTTTFLRGDGTWASTSGGTVTAVSIATANGFSGSSSGGATPALTIVAGAITPTSVAATSTISGTQLTSTIVTGTPPFVVTSTTPVANLNIGGNAATATTATGFSGSLAGDVTGTQGATAIGASKVTNAMLAGSIDLTTKVTGILPVANGGTGSSGALNFIDLTTTQTAAGAKTWSSLGTFTGGITSTGTNNISLSGDATGTTLNIGTGAGAKLVSLGSANGASSLVERVGAGNYSLDGVAGSTYSIGASTTTGTISVGGTAQTGAITVGSSSGTQILNLGTGAGAATVNIANGTAGNIVSIANGANTVAQTTNIGAGANAANNTINIGSGLNTAGTTAITIGSNQNLANTTLIAGGNGAGAITLDPYSTGSIVIGDAAGIGAITLGSSSSAQTVNVGTGAGVSTVNIATGGAASVVTIGDNTGATSGTTLIGGSITMNGSMNYGADTQANDSYVINLSPAPTAYVVGMQIVFKANTVNTGTASINVNGLGAKTIVKRVNTLLSNNDIAASKFCLLVFDGTNFVLLNPAAL